MSKWQDAHVGEDSSGLTVRMTGEEKQRLEQLRGDLRLTSKGQVIRAALDLLELAALGGDALTRGDLAETRRVMRRARRAVGVPRSEDLEAAAADDAIAKNKNLKTSYKHLAPQPDGDAGLPSAAPAGDHGEV